MTGSALPSRYQFLFLCVPVLGGARARQTLLMDRGRWQMKPTSSSVRAFCGPAGHFVQSLLINTNNMRRRTCLTPILTADSMQLEDDTVLFDPLIFDFPVHPLVLDQQLFRSESASTVSTQLEDDTVLFDPLIFDFPVHPLVLDQQLFRSESASTVSTQLEDDTVLFDPLIFDFPVHPLVLDQQLFRSESASTVSTQLEDDTVLFNPLIF
ncbi:hypothetical protein FPQ18DRAFT_20043 [Pyronema domesticum]|nr:hypothetical protein FPQ18DRAFT_20043 [Pyronema domesticum]